MFEEVFYIWIKITPYQYFEFILCEDSAYLKQV